MLKTGDMEMSQLDRVLKRLKKGPLTQKQASDELGVSRLGARVYDLKERGHKIYSEIIETTNRFGDVCHVARYRLIK